VETSEGRTTSGSVGAVGSEAVTGWELIQNLTAGSSVFLPTLIKHQRPI